MCDFKSMVVTRTAVLWSDKHDEHARLIVENGLNDSTKTPEFVRVELVPNGTDYCHLPAYKFRVDQDVLPDWWDAREGEIAARAELEKIMKPCIKNGALIHFPGDCNVFYSETLDAPALETIGGDCVVHGTAMLDAPVLKSIGDRCVIYRAGTLDAPALKTIGGNCNVFFSAKLDAPALETVNGEPWVINK